MESRADLSLRSQTCCFTGHRIIPTGLGEVLSKWLEDTVRGLIGEGYRYFGTGGALEFDTLAAEAVLRLRADFPYIRLVLVLPCRNQAQNWKPKDIVRYEHIQKDADKVVYTGEAYAPGCMHKRNRHLVDYSAVCVAYCTRSTGGAAYTVKYAQKCGCKVIRWPCDGLGPI